MRLFKRPKGQAAFEYIILLGIFLTMSTLIIMYSNNEIKSYIDNSELEDNIRSIIRSAEMVASQGQGASQVIQINMPKGIAQAFASGNDVVFRTFTSDERYSDVHFTSPVKIFGLMEPEKGIKQFVITAQKNGYVSISPIMSPNMMDHLVAYYDMDYKNSTHILDATGKSPAGRINRSICSVEGVIGKGCMMNGTDQNIFIENFNMSYDEFSLAVWFNPNQTQFGRRIVDDSWYGGGCSLAYDGVFSTHINSDGTVGCVACQLNWTPGPFVNGVRVMEYKAWHQLVVSYNSNGRMNEYIDGVLEGYFSGALPPRKKSSTLLIGSMGSSTFNGTLDQVMIFDKALSADEVKKLYYLGRNDQ